MSKHLLGPKTIDEYTAALRHRIEAKPYQALAAAIGIGIVLGGGLWKHLARSLLNVGGRLAVTAAVALLADSLSPVAESERSSAPHLDIDR